VIVREAGRASDDGSGLQALAFLWRGRWIIALCTLLGAGGGVGYAQRRGTIYRARSVLYVQHEAPVLGTEVSVWLQSRNYANTQAALLRSTPVLEAALAATGAEIAPLFGDSHNLMTWTRRHLAVTVGTEDDLITVSLDAVEAEAACRLVNAVVDAYLAFRTRTQRQAASGVLTDLKAELARYEGELRDVQREQVEFLTAHRGVSAVRESATVQTERLREINAALTRAELDAMQADAAWQAAARQAEAPDPLQRLALPGVDAALQRATIETLQRLQELRAQRLQLLADVTLEHPSVRQVDGVIAGLERQVDAETRHVAQAHVAGLEQRRRAAQGLCTDLAARVREQEQLMHSIDPAQAEYRGLEIRFERARKIADALYERIRSIDINENIGETERPQLNALVYDYANAAGSMVASSKTSIAALAVGAGALCGVLLAWLRVALDQRLRDPADVAGYLPLLATVPRVRVDRRDALRTWARSPEFAATMLALRTVLHFGQRGASNRTLQVVAPRAGDGASLIAAGLGIALAQSGQRTLLVDADLGRAAQAALFGAGHEPGLRHVLAGRAAAADVIVATPIEGLDLLPAGSRGVALPDLLDATRLQTTLRQIAGAYDRVLIDSPPLLDAVDGRIVAAVSDGSLLVVRAAHTTRTAMAAALAVVASVAGSVCGAVLNRSPQAVGPAGAVPGPRRAEGAAAAGSIAAAEVAR
jgi:capsular exopolysaccharide synthesis family protein